jgi:hypothetical protein
MKYLIEDFTILLDGRRGIEKSNMMMNPRGFPARRNFKHDRISEPVPAKVGEGSSKATTTADEKNRRIPHQTIASFSDIIGNDTTKQALYENIVLPLTLSVKIKRQIFAGIRGGSGNVLLHGG